MALKIKTEMRDGEQRVNEDTMELLLAFGQHKQFCDDCERVTSGKGGNYCQFGDSLIRQLLDRPDVEFVPEETK